MPRKRVELAHEPVSRGKLFWTWDGRLLFPFGRLPVRMHIAGYEKSDGRTGLVVIAPLEPTDKVVEWLEATGDVCFIVAPNKQHWWWASAMKEAFPAALLVAPMGLKQKEPQLPVDVRVTPLAGVGDLPGSWPVKEFDIIPIQGASFLEELAILHKPSSTLIITDIAFNFDEACIQTTQPGWLFKAYLSLSDGYRRCCTTKVMSYMMDPVKASFDQILATWEFDRVSVCHGSFIDKDGKQAFLEGSYAFVDALVRKKQQAAAGAQSGGLAGTLPAMLTAGAVICTAVGIGIAGILQARQK